MTMGGSLKGRAARAGMGGEGWGVRGWCRPPASASMVEAHLEGATVVVRVQERRPPAGAITAQVITSPYCLARLHRGGWSRVRFVDATGASLGELALPNP